MWFYVIGVDKHDPNSDQVFVKLRVYTQKPDPKSTTAPNGKNAGELQMIVSDAERSTWQDRVGKMADGSALQFK